MLFLLFVFIIEVKSNAQLFDSLKLNVGTITTIASEDYQPLWTVSNRFGTISERKFDFSSHFSFFNTHNDLLNSKKDKSNDDVQTDRRTLNLSYALDIYNNNGFGDIFLKEAFLRLKYDKWQLSIGRFEEIIGEVHPELSSGSLGISSNARPIPKLSFKNTDFVDVPFTNGWLQFKGLISHGWLGEERLLRDAYLHEKYFYLRFGKNKIKLYGGVQHFGIWGGTESEFYTLDRSFSGFLDVLFVKEANDGSVPPGKLPNRAGYQRGSVDGGIIIEGKSQTINIYTQTPIVTGTSITIKNIDRLVGFSIDKTDKKSLFQSFVFEFLYTKQMSDFPSAKEPYYYYTNGVYITGWNYLGNIIGTPLIINRNRGSKYFSELAPPIWDPDSYYDINYNILSNRVMAGHFGAICNLSQKVRSRTLLSFTRNYGNSSSVQFFAPYKDQFYALQEIYYKPNGEVTLLGGLGIDMGELSDNVGLFLGFEKNI